MTMKSSIYTSVYASGGALAPPKVMASVWNCMCGEWMWCVDCVSVKP